MCTCTFVTVSKSPFCFFCGIAGSRNSDFLLMPGSGGLAGPGCDFIANFLLKKNQWMSQFERYQMLEPIWDTKTAITKLKGFYF